MLLKKTLLRCSTESSKRMSAGMMVTNTRGTGRAP